MRLVPSRELEEAQEKSRDFQYTHSDIRLVEDGLGSDVDTVDAKLDDVSWAEPTRALDTVYQNTSGKIRFVSISISGAGNYAFVRMGASSSPTTIICYIGQVDGDRTSCSFIVPVDWYYTLVSVGTPTLAEWHEWDLH